MYRPMLSTLRRINVAIWSIIRRGLGSDIEREKVVEPPLRYYSFDANQSNSATVGTCIICFEDVEKGSLAIIDCECQYVAHDQCIGLWQQTHPQNGCIVCRKPMIAPPEQITNEQWERIRSRLKSLAGLSVIMLVFYIAIYVHDMYQWQVLVYDVQL